MMTSTSLRDGNLSQWVSNIQERHGENADNSSRPDATNSTSSAADLEEEIRKSRAERAKRRSQVVSPIPFDTNSSSQIAPTSGQDTLRKLLGERGGATSTDMKTTYTPPSFASYSPPKQSHSLLDRYGGSMGLTGVAKAGTKDSPASLASFMGGKASGPRLGKLQGDGRTTPAEYSLIDHTDRRALPGMAKGGGGGTSLASFLEARAGNQPRPTPIRNDSGNHQTLSATTQTDTYSSQHYDRATSPLKAEQVAAFKELSPSKAKVEKLRNASSVSTSLAPASVVHSPTSDALHQPTSPSASGKSPAFQATQLANDRMPTASLTRLRSKKMVEQRVREAQERASTDPGPNSSPVTRSTPTWMASAHESKSTPVEVEVKDVKSRWPVVEEKHTSPTVEKRTPFAPARFGNALPGMGQPRTGPTRNLYASNNKDHEERNEVNSLPIRLPGMGSAQSPFAARQAAMEAEQETSAAVQPLEQLARGRAKPKRMARTSEVKEVSLPGAESIPEANLNERISRQDFSAAREAFDNPPPRATSPHKPQLHLSLDLPQTPSKSLLRQDSIPNSADKRLADSTAALEALLEGKSVKTPTIEKSKMSYQPDKIKRSGTLRIARNKDSHTTIDTSAIHRSLAKSIVPNSVSVEVLLIKSDGSNEVLHGEEAKVLHDSETQIITHRFRDSTSNITTKVFARTGRRSRLLVDPNCIEARKVQEIGKHHRTTIVDARQGRESIELVKLMGGTLITREGSRKSIEKDVSSMFQVRGSEGAHYIDQVDILTSSLCSAHSVIVLLQGDVFVWHGVGSISSNRQTALQYSGLLKSSSKGQQSTISEYEEGEEDEFFWTCFEQSAPYSSAWHHKFTPLLADGEVLPRLFSVSGQGSSKKLVDQSDFSLVDIRRDGLHILQLPLEIYVLIGPDARSRRKEIHTCIEAASTLARNVSNQRGSTIMTPPVHVVVFPTIPPRELRSAFRYWHDEHLNGKGWQRAGLSMNVWERRLALEQLQMDEFQLWQVNDELFLPVGVGLEDVQGIDV